MAIKTIEEIFEEIGQAQANGQPVMSTPKYLPNEFCDRITLTIFCKNDTIVEKVKNHIDTTYNGWRKEFRVKQMTVRKCLTVELYYDQEEKA